MSAPRLRIALVVHGRFHAFHLAGALSALGHDVSVFTNYPAWAARRFGVRRVRSLWLHGIVVRALQRLSLMRRSQRVEALMHRWFGRWAANRVMRERWDVVHVWSGVAEELLGAQVPAPVFLARGSAHIRAQDRLLAGEQRRSGAKVERPSDWMIRREEREYARARRIIVPSRFARRTFLEEGVDAAKLGIVTLAADARAFRAPPSAVRARAQRLRAGEPLRVLYVGNVSYQKGMADLAAIARAVSPERFRFRIVGPAADAIGLFRGAPPHVTVVGKVGERELPREYAWADLFLFPTIQDGFAVVLCQAQAAALPILATENCGASELVTEGREGWCLPIRSPAKFVERLDWCDRHRAEVAAMVEAIHARPSVRTWEDAAQDFLEQVGGVGEFSP